MIRFKAIHQVAAIAILLGWAAMPANAQVLTLVSEAEVSADRAAQPPPGIRGAPSRSAPNPDAPRIEIMAPQIAGAPLGRPLRHIMLAARSYWLGWSDPACTALRMPSRL